MSFVSLGDMAQAFSLRHRNTILKSDILNLNQELATGQAADLAAHLGGSYAGLTAIEREGRVLRGYEISIAEAKVLTDSMQVRLEQISEISSDYAGKLITASASGNTSARDALAEEAKMQFSTVVDILNSQAAGRSMFAGDATDGPALISADDMLDELENVLTGALSLVDIETRLDDWFTDPAGFDAFAYVGGTAGIASFKMSEITQVEVDIRANAPEIKDVLQGLAKAYIAGSDDYSLDTVVQNALRSNSATEVMTAQKRLVDVQANLGLAQEQIEKWSVRTQTERLGLDYAKGALIAIDPYEKATELEAAQFQLESLYTVTARLSQLSLVNFLR